MPSSVARLMLVASAGAIALAPIAATANTRTTTNFTRTTGNGFGAPTGQISNRPLTERYTFFPGTNAIIIADNNGSDEPVSPGA